MTMISSTLLGFPLAIFANLTTSSITQKLSKQKYDRIFYNALLKAIDLHNKQYDQFSKDQLKQLKSLIKRDGKLQIIQLFYKTAESLEDIISIKNRDIFIENISKELVERYSNDISNIDPKVLHILIHDTLKLYQEAFYCSLNTDNSLRLLISKTLQIENNLDLFSKLNKEIATKSDVNSLKKALHNFWFDNNKEFKLGLTEYYKYLNNRFEYIDQRGFSPKVAGREIKMKLSEIFIPFKIQRQSSVFQDISSLKTSKQFKFGIPNPDFENNYLKILQEYNKIIILGDPGSGKSTLLKFIAIEVIRKRKEDSFNNIVPIHIKIADYADYYRNSKKSFYDFIIQTTAEPYQQLFRESINYSNAIILIDGLDEIISTPLRMKIIEKVQDTMAMFPYNNYIITSRKIGYNETSFSGDIYHFMIRSFSLIETRKFIKSWYKSIAMNSDQDFKNAKKISDSLIYSIQKNKSVLRLAANPLLLTIIAMIHYKGKKLPNKRIELYDISTETFLEYWVQQRVDDDTQLQDKNDIIDILSPIAYKIHDERSDGLITENEFKTQFIKLYQQLNLSNTNKAKEEYKKFKSFIQDYAGFFFIKGTNEENVNLYGFIHLTFEEYLAAIHLINLWKDGKCNIKEYIFNPRWIEILRLSIAQLNLNFGTGKSDISKFIKEILNVDDNFPDANRPLQLILLILTEEISLSKETLEEIINKSIALFKEDQPFILMKAIAAIFQEIFLTKFKDIFIDKFRIEIGSGNKEFIKNITFIYTLNSDNPSIFEELNKLFQCNEIVFRTVYYIQPKNYYFQKTESFNDNFNKFIKLEKINHKDQYKLINYYYNFLQANLNENYFDVLEKKEYKKIYNAIYNQKEIRKELLNVFLPYVIAIFLRKEISYQDIINSLPWNLKRIKSVQNFIHILDSYAQLLVNEKFGIMILYYLNDEYSAILLNDENDNDNHYYLYFFSISTGKSILKKFNFQNKSKKIEQYTSEFNLSKSGNTRLRLSIEHMSYKYLKESRKQVSIFINAYKQNYLYDTFGWELFPILNIEKNIRELSGIILEKFYQYNRKIRDEYYKGESEKLKKIIHNNLISPVIRLFLCQKNNYSDKSQKLLEKSIKLYNEENSKKDIKENVFEIIYKSIDPFNLIK